MLQLNAGVAIALPPAGPQRLRAAALAAPGVNVVALLILLSLFLVASPMCVTSSAWRLPVDSP